MKKSIAIIGEGETEWFYFDSLRVASRYPFRLAPDFPAHSDIDHLLKLSKASTTPRTSSCCPNYKSTCPVMRRQKVLC